MSHELLVGAKHEVEAMSTESVHSSPNQRHSSVSDQRGPGVFSPVFLMTKYKEISFTLLSCTIPSS
jgi:hypothetical protein